MSDEVFFVGNRHTVENIVGPGSLNIVEAKSRAIVCDCYIGNVDRIEFRNIVYTPDLTCRDVGKMDWQCSECGARNGDPGYDIGARWTGEYRYCPHCGAKVIE